mmetsp:Transcript_55137/g.133964  ORF Transcript_55137/g.133964 Transcript_55137/m.133964 type:complete len:424 (-) Transcript_55137:356-1627(-)
MVTPDTAMITTTTTTTTGATDTESFLPADRVSNDSDDGSSPSSSPRPSGPPDGVDTDGKSMPSLAVSDGQQQPQQQQQKTDIGALVAKSKRAASSLWTLLHAKNCRLGVNRCGHSGCAEAKLIYLHLKTCSAGPLDPCPSNHKGCQDARKLLAHYRRCRDIRTRQAQSPSKSQQQHVCLVCSLVARHAKFSLERGTGAGSNRGNGSSSKNNNCLTKSHYNIPSLNLTCESISEHETPDQFSLNQSFEENKGYLSSQQRYEQSRPRFAFSRTNRSPPSTGFSALLAASSSTGIDGDRSAPHQRPRSGSMPVHQPDQNGTMNGGQDQEEQRENSMNYLYLAAVDSLNGEQKASQTGRQEDVHMQDQNHANGTYTGIAAPEPGTLRRKRSETWSVSSAASSAAAAGVNPVSSDPLECVLENGRRRH